MTQTPHYQLPLPHPTNALSADVVNLRNALVKIDAALWASGGADAATIAALQTLVANINTAVTQLKHHRQSGYLPTETVVARDTNNTVVERVTETVGGQNRVTQFTRDTNGVITHYQVEYAGVKRQYTIQRDPNTGAYLGETSLILGA